MSIYDKSSLVLIPSGTKTGKVYSQKPVSGDGDFTFTRSSAATRVNADGNIEKETQNLLLQSNSFDTTWAVSTSSISVTGGQSGYDGSSDAWLLERSDASSRYITQSVTSSGVNTFSVYAKPDSVGWIYVYVAGGGVARTAYFDITNGALGSTSNVITTSIEAAGNGYYRCSIVVDATITTIRLYPAVANGSVTGGVAPAGIYIQDAQLNQGLIAQEVITTTTAAVEGGITDNVPRLDYTDSSCPSLKLEPQRTNLISQSEFYGGSDWARTRCGFVTNTSETLSPEGLYNASKMTSTDASESYAQDNVTLGSTSGTFTFFAKKGDLDYCHALVWDISANGRRQWFNLATGAVGTTTNFGSGYTKVDASIEDYGNGWYRCSFSWSGGNTTSGVRINISSGDGVIGSPINSYGYFYGAQCEASASYATSYIPTYGSSVTRTTESFVELENLNTNSITNANSAYTIFFDLSSEPVLNVADGNSIILYSYNGENKTSSYITLRKYYQDADGKIRFYSNLDAATMGYVTSTNKKFAMVVNGTTIKVFSDGGLEFTYTATNNHNGVGSLQLAAGSSQRTSTNYSQFLLFNSVLTDAECIDLTT